MRRAQGRFDVSRLLAVVRRGGSFGLQEQQLLSVVGIPYLYQPGKLEGGCRRATDLIWASRVYQLRRGVVKPDVPVLYCLLDGLARSFVREKLLPVSPDTELPPTHQASISGTKRIQDETAIVV